MNWVEERAKTERLILDKAPDTWSKIRAALQDACKSFNEHYNTPSKVQCDLENGRRVRIVRYPPGKGRVELVIEFQADAGVIHVAELDRAYTLRFVPDFDGINNTLSIIDGAGKMNPDQTSKYILEEVLFPRED